MKENEQDIKESQLVSTKEMDESATKIKQHITHYWSPHECCRSSSTSSTCSCWYSGSHRKVAVCDEYCKVVSKSAMFLQPFCFPCLLYLSLYCFKVLFLGLSFSSWLLLSCSSDYASFIFALSSFYLCFRVYSLFVLVSRLLRLSNLASSSLSFLCSMYSRSIQTVLHSQK